MTLPCITLYNQSLPSSEQIFTDPFFPPSDVSIYGREQKKLAHYQGGITWRRASEIAANANLWDETLETVVPVQQGRLGDCWLIAVLNLLPKSLLVTLFQNNLKKAATPGLYCVRLSLPNHFLDILIDDYIPCDAITLDPLFARPASNSNTSHSSKTYPIWGMLIEKAYAKWKGSYSCLESGNACDVMMDLGCHVAEHVDLRDIKGLLEEELKTEEAVVPSIEKKSEQTFEESPEKTTFEKTLQTETQVPMHLHSTLYHSPRQHYVNLFHYDCTHPFKSQPFTLNRSGFCYWLKNQWENGAWITCSIPMATDESEPTAKQKSPFMPGHSYSVMKIEENREGEIMIQLRNPWGRERGQRPLFDGPLPESFTYQKLSVWITEHYSVLWTCGIGNKKSKLSKSNEFQFNETWSSSNKTAGGCINYRSGVYENPQWLLDVRDTMQLLVLISTHDYKSYDQKKVDKTAALHRSHGCLIVRVPDNWQQPLTMSVDAQGKWLSTSTTSPYGLLGTMTYMDARDVSARFDLSPGRYVLLATCFDRNVEGRFTLALRGSTKTGLEKFFKVKPLDGSENKKSGLTRSRSMSSASSKKWTQSSNCLPWPLPVESLRGNSFSLCHLQVQSLRLPQIARDETVFLVAFTSSKQVMGKSPLVELLLSRETQDVGWTRAFSVKDLVNTSSNALHNTMAALALKITKQTRALWIALCRPPLRESSDQVLILSMTRLLFDELKKSSTDNKITEKPCSWQLNVPWQSVQNGASLGESILKCRMDDFVK